MGVGLRLELVGMESRVHGVFGLAVVRWCHVDFDVTREVILRFLVQPEAKPNACKVFSLCTSYSTSMDVMSTALITDGLNTRSRPKRLPLFNVWVDRYLKLMVLSSCSTLTPGTQQNAAAGSVSSLGISGVSPMETLPIAVPSTTALAVMTGIAVTVLGGLAIGVRVNYPLSAPIKERWRI